MTRFHGDLLQPSLSGDSKAPVAAPYSTTTSFLSAFFGGPYALLIIAALNVQRLGRWRRDGLVLAGMLMAALTWSLVLPEIGLFARIWAAVNQALGSGGWRYVERAFSLLLWALLYWRHRSIDKAANVFGLDRPNGLVAGIGAIVCGMVVGALLPMLLVKSPAA